MFPDFIGKAKQKIKREVSDYQPIQGAYKYRPAEKVRQDIGMTVCFHYLMCRLKDAQYPCIFKHGTS